MVGNFPKDARVRLAHVKRPGVRSLPTARPSRSGIVTAAESGRSRKPPSRRSRGSGGAGVHGTQADQRARLLEAIVSLTATSGYAQTRVGDLASSAGVSRATFYELFKNKEECFIAAHDELSECLLADTAGVLTGKGRKRPTDAIVGAIVEFAAGQPEQFSFLTYEAMLAGPTAWDRRERLIAALAE